MGAKGRWPANVILDDEAAALLDAQSGVRKSGGRTDQTNSGGGSVFTNRGPNARGAAHVEPSAGGASRYFLRLNTRAEVVEWLTKLVTPPGGVVLHIGEGT